MNRISALKLGLIKARDLIKNPDNWGKGNGLRGPLKPQYCIISAIDTKAGTNWMEKSDYLAEHLPAPFHTGDALELADFNDDPATTHADVMALFDRAIAKLDVEEFKQLTTLSIDGRGLESESAAQERGDSKTLAQLTDELSLSWARQEHF